MNNNQLAAQYRALADKVVRSHIEDIDCDVNSIFTQLDPKKRTCDFLIFQLRECGTYCTQLWNITGLPTRKGLHPFMFGESTGEHILDQMYIYRDRQSDEDRLHFVFDIGRKTIKPIKYKAALLLVDQQSRKVSQAWNMQHAK